MAPASRSAGSASGFDSRLEVQRVAHLLVSNDVPGTVAWDSPSTPAAGEMQRWDLRVTPHFEARAETPLRLELDLAPAPPLGTPEAHWSVPAHRRVHTSLVVGEQQPVILGLPRGAGTTPTSVMVVMPYLIREPADLRRLFECKMRQRREASASF